MRGANLQVTFSTTEIITTALREQDITETYSMIQ